MVTEQNGLQLLRKHSGKILDQTSARDVRHRLDRTGQFREHVEHRLNVDLCRGHQRIRQGALSGVARQERGIQCMHPLVFGAHSPLEDPSDQGKSIGMHATRSQTQHDIARLDRAPIQNRRFFNNAYRESRQVVFAVGIHPRHFSRFAADQ